MTAKARMAFAVVEAAMRELDPAEQSAMARAFVNRYGNEIALDDAPELSPREWEILRLLADGQGTVQAALTMGVGERTFGTYISNLQRKLSANNRTHAVAQAFRKGML